jgi:hypothetical protein
MASAIVTPHRPPGALELVDLGDQRQDFRRDAKGCGIERHTVAHPFPPNYWTMA